MKPPLNKTLCAVENGHFLRQTWLIDVYPENVLRPTVRVSRNVMLFWQYRTADVLAPSPILWADKLSSTNIPIESPSNNQFTRTGYENQDRNNKTKHTIHTGLKRTCKRIGSASVTIRLHTKQTSLFTQTGTNIKDRFYLSAIIFLK